MEPSVGRIVHYVSYGTPGGEFTSQCRAAVITEVEPLPEWDGAQADVEQWDEEARVLVGLAVLNPSGLFFDRGLVFEPNRRPGTWHWPERVGEQRPTWTDPVQPPGPGGGSLTGGT